LRGLDSDIFVGQFSSFCEKYFQKKKLCEKCPVVKKNHQEVILQIEKKAPKKATTAHNSKAAEDIIFSYY
jgi:hypothetical protein